MTISERKNREKEMRRKEIIDTAEKLFFENGYENINMADIAEGAELARSTLYLYFKNKKEIYLAISLRGTETLNALFREYYNKGETGLEKVKMLMNAFYKFHTEFPDYYKVNWSLYNVSIDEDSPNIKEISELRKEGFLLFQKALEDGIADKSIRQDLDPVKANLFVASSIQNAFNLPPTIKMHMENNKLTHEELIDYTMDMLIHSLKC